MRLVYTSIVSLSIILAGCGGSSGDGGNNNGTVNNTLPTTVPARIASTAIDYGNNGNIELETFYEYDDEGRLVKLTNTFTADSARNTVEEYEYVNGNLVKISNSFDTTELTYENNKVVSITVTRNSDSAQLLTTTYKYDNDGRLVAVGGENIFYSTFTCGSDYAMLETSTDVTLNYDGSRLTSVTSDDGHFTQTNQYNAAGSLTRSIDNYACADYVEHTAITLNSSNQVTKVRYYDELKPDAEPDTFFDADEGTTDITYNNNGLVQSVVFTDEFETNVNSYIYNADGLPTSIVSDTTTSNQSNFTSPDFTATFQYENKSCKVALSADPASIAQGSPFSILTAGRNNPNLCLYPFD